MNAKRLRPGLAIALLACAAPDLSSENVTLSTYYPSPSGAYTQMIVTGNTLLARDGGAVAIGLNAASTKLEIAQNTAIKLGSAHLSSGGDFVNLANNEWYDGAGWRATAPGALFQISGQAMNFYRHDAGGGHILSMSLASTGDLGLSGKLEVAQNAAFKLGSAYLSSGGDLVNLANNEWYDGAAWQASAPGALIQIAGQTTNFYRHDSAGGHTLSMRLGSTGNLSLRGALSVVDGTQGAGKVLTSNAAGDASWQTPSGAVRGPAVYQCPNAKPCCSGGAWGFYGCQGQITTAATCQTIEYPCSCSTACTPIGFMALAP